MNLESNVCSGEWITQQTDPHAMVGGQTEKKHIQMRYGRFNSSVIIEHQ